MGKIDMAVCLPKKTARLPYSIPDSAQTIRFSRGKVSVDEAIDHIKKAIAFVEAEAAGNFEAKDEQEEAGGLQ